MSRIATQRLIAAAPCLRSASIAHAAPRAVYFHARQSSSLPTVAQSDFWKGLVPKPFRREPQLPGDPSIKRVKSKKKKKEWNPATFYIVIFLLIGSMSINMLSSKQSFEAFSRQADVRIGVLKEVVEKIQRGEKVDVEEALGTGDPQKELEWEEMLREIEREDVSRQKKQEKSRQTESVKSKPEKEAKSHSTGVSEAAKPPARGMSSFF